MLFFPTGNNPKIHPQWQPEYFGNVIIVNGKAWPFLEVKRRKYRFRIINTSNARYFRFSLTNGLSFIVLGSDTSYLSSPVKSSNITVAPAEIMDVLVDFSEVQGGNESELINDAPYPYPTGDAVDELNSKIMKFIIKPAGDQIPADNSQVPVSLISYHTSAVTAATTKR